MKGHAFRKLSRTSSHRTALLRNLVTSLIQHERISTTVAKAKEAQRQAEKIITKARRALQDPVARGKQLVRARAYLYSPDTTLPLLAKLAERYVDRPGGYTRLHLHGARKGDNAPRALLELVDSTKGDVRLEMTARAVGRETYLHYKRSLARGVEPFGASGSAPTRGGGGSGGKGVLYDEILTASQLQHDTRFHPATRRNLAKLGFVGSAPAASGSGGGSGRSRSSTDASGGEAERHERLEQLVEKARDHFRRLQVLEEMHGAPVASASASASSSWVGGAATEVGDEARWAALDESRPVGDVVTRPRLGRTRRAGEAPLSTAITSSSSSSSAEAAAAAAAGETDEELASWRRAGVARESMASRRRAQRPSVHGPSVVRLAKGVFASTSRRRRHGRGGRLGGETSSSSRTPTPPP